MDDKDTSKQTLQSWPFRAAHEPIEATGYCATNVDWTELTEEDLYEASSPRLPQLRRRSYLLGGFAKLSNLRRLKDQLPL